MMMIIIIIIIIHKVLILLVPNDFSSSLIPQVKVSSEYFIYTLYVLVQM